MFEFSSAFHSHSTTRRPILLPPSLCSQNTPRRQLHLSTLLSCCTCAQNHSEHDGAIVQNMEEISKWRFRFSKTKAQCRSAFHFVCDAAYFFLLTIVPFCCSCSKIYLHQPSFSVCFPQCSIEQRRRTHITPLCMLLLSCLHFSIVRA